MSKFHFLIDLADPSTNLCCSKSLAVTAPMLPLVSAKKSYRPCLWQVNLKGMATALHVKLICFAGIPTTVLLSRTSIVTTAPAPTLTLEPIVMP